MSTQTVQLDAEAEVALKTIIERTGLTAPDAIKQALLYYSKSTLDATDLKPSDFFDERDLGAGGDALVPARSNKLRELVAGRLKKKRSKAQKILTSIYMVPL